jgi:predicted GIY-YIG superfamily endonuclease
MTEDVLYSTYGLIDPRYREVFYIGFSSNVKQRVMHHGSDSAISSYDRCREIRAAGLRPDYVVFGLFATAHEAKRLERALVHSLNGLVNKGPQGLLSEVLYPFGVIDTKMVSDGLRVVAGITATLHEGWPVKHGWKYDA